MDTDTKVLGERRHFVKTTWSLVRAARNVGALDALVRLYWKPLYFFLRQRGLDNETAKDVVQDFLAHVIERKALLRADPARGRFRTFLLAALMRFLADRRKSARRLKRGGGAAVLSLDFERGEREYVLQVEAGETPDRTFDRTWARQLLETCLEALEGDPRHVEALRLRLRGEEYRTVSRRTGLSEAAAQVAVHRLSKPFGEAVSAHLRALLRDPADFDAELSDFLSLLG